MGSFGDHAKGENPELNWVREHQERWNRRCAMRAAAVPFWRKLLAWLGYSRPSVQWQEAHWYDF
jgi:hypothetical protein